MESARVPVNGNEAMEQVLARDQRTTAHRPRDQCRRFATRTVGRVTVGACDSSCRARFGRSRFTNVTCLSKWRSLLIGSDGGRIRGWFSSFVN